MKHTPFKVVINVEENIKERIAEMKSRCFPTLGSNRGGGGGGGGVGGGVNSDDADDGVCNSSEPATPQRGNNNVTMVTDEMNDNCIDESALLVGDDPMDNGILHSLMCVCATYNLQTTYRHYCANCVIISLTLTTSLNTCKCMPITRRRMNVTTVSTSNFNLNHTLLYN
jgi:hypothetical protein